MTSLTAESGRVVNGPGLLRIWGRGLGGGQCKDRESPKQIRMIGHPAVGNRGGRGEGVGGRGIMAANTYFVKNLVTLRTNI